MEKYCFTVTCVILPDCSKPFWYLCTAAAAAAAAAKSFQSCHARAGCGILGLCRSFPGWPGPPGAWRSPCPLVASLRSSLSVSSLSLVFFRPLSVSVRRWSSHSGCCLCGSSRLFSVSVPALFIYFFFCQACVWFVLFSSFLRFRVLIWGLFKCGVYSCQFSSVY